MGVDGFIVFAGENDALWHARQFANEGLMTLAVTTGEDLARTLADRFDIALVVVEVRLADAALLAALQAPGAPRAIFIGADDVDGITLSPNVAAYLDAEARADEVRAAVLAALPEQQGLAVGDFSDRDAQRLNSLGREVERIARALSDIATASQNAGPPEVAIEPAYVRAVIRRRRERERFFPSELFSDPAWDMLLDLTAARLERRLVSVSSLCIAAAVPTTTALRWIRNLCDLGLFERNIDPDDMRRGLISLTDATAERMLSYLAAGRAAGTVVV